MLYFGLIDSNKSTSDGYIYLYTHAHLWFPPSFLPVNHHYSKNWVPSILTHNLWLIFKGMKQKKKIFFLKKKIQNGRLKKTEFFNFVKSWANSAKISWIRPWVSRIEWCEGHWFCSTYMAMRLSDICSKTGKKHKKCIFCLFWSICQTAQFFWVGHFEFFFTKKKIFFASSPWKLVTNYMLEWMGLNFYHYDGLQPKMRAGIINEHECTLIFCQAIIGWHFCSLILLDFLSQEKLTQKGHNLLRLDVRPFKYLVI